MLRFLPSAFFWLLFAHTALTAPTHSRQQSVRDYSKACPYEPDVQVIIELWAPDLKTNLALNVTYKARGSSGCAYEGTLTFPEDKATGRSAYVVTTVAKTPVWGRGRFAETEILALRGVNELYAYGYGNDDLPWLAMKQQPGKPIFETAAWKKRFPLNYNTDPSDEAVESCKAFMEEIYTLIVNRVAHYVEEYGWDQRDQNWSNFLFSDDLKRVNIVDWGWAVEVRKTPAAVSALRAERFMGLKWFGQLPPVDTKMLTTNKQGVCQSNMRASGEAWRDPMGAIGATPLAKTTAAL